MISLAQALNYLSLKMFYPFCGFIYPIFGITFLEYVYFISFSNIASFTLFFVQPLFEYFATNYVLFLLQLISIVSMSMSLVFTNYWIVLLFCRMTFIFCINSVWAHANRAIRSFTMNSVVSSRRHLLLHSLSQMSTFLLFIAGYAVQHDTRLIKYMSPIQMILFSSMALTFVLSMFYIPFVPSKKLRIKYYDESCVAVIKRTWSLLQHDLFLVLSDFRVCILIVVNVLGAINLMMITFIYGIWLQHLLHLNIGIVALYTLVQAISELFVSTVNFNKCANRNQLSVLAIFVSILFVSAFLLCTYLTFEYCNNVMAGERICEWLDLSKAMAKNQSILIICLSGTFIGHEIYTVNVSNIILGECRRYNAAHAAFPVCNTVQNLSALIGQLLAGLLWIQHFDQTRSILPILGIMLTMDTMAFFCLLYAFTLNGSK